MKIKQQQRDILHHCLNTAKSSKGFTLIEIMVYLALVSGILITATTFAWSVINSRTKAFTIQEVEQNGRYITQKIVGIIQEANSITLPTIGNTTGNLTLVMDDGGTENISINLNGEILEWQQDVGPTILLNSDQVRVTKMEFTNLSSVNDRSRNIKLVMTVEHINPNNRNEWKYIETFETTVELRDR